MTMRKTSLLMAVLCCATAQAVAQQALCLDESFQADIVPEGDVENIAFMDDGRIIAAGSLVRPYYEDPWGSRYIVDRRFFPDGSIDWSFHSQFGGGGGVKIWGADHFYMTIGASMVCRLHLADGMTDTGYQCNNQPEFETSQRAQFQTFADGRQWRLGSYKKKHYDEEGNYLYSEPGYGLLQTLGNGHIDPDFDHKWLPMGMLWSIVELPDGRFLLGATRATEYEGRPVGAIFRVDDEAHLDTTFHTTISWGAFARQVYHYPDGRLLVFGRMTAPEYPGDTLFAMRLHPDGSTDATWPVIPFRHFTGNPVFTGITDFLEIEPGKLLVVGTFNYVGDVPVGAITTLDTAGNVLLDYLPGTGAGFTEAGVIGNFAPNCRIYGIREGPDGFIYLWGTFKGYNDGCGDHPDHRMLVRLYPLDVGVGELPGPVPEFTAHPNPGGDQLSLFWDVPGRYEVAIRDLQGRTVWHGHHRKDDGPLDVAALVPGMYAVATLSADGRRSTIKWMKQ